MKIKVWELKTADEFENVYKEIKIKYEKVISKTLGDMHEFSRCETSLKHDIARLRWDEKHVEKAKLHADTLISIGFSADTAQDEKRMDGERKQLIDTLKYFERFCRAEMSVESLSERLENTKIDEYRAAMAAWLTKQKKLVQEALKITQLFESDKR